MGYLGNAYWARYAADHGMVWYTGMVWYGMGGLWVMHTGLDMPLIMVWYGIPVTGLWYGMV